MSVNDLLKPGMNTRFPPTFSLGAVVHLLLLARLQVWMRQGVMRGWSTQ